MRPLGVIGHLSRDIVAGGAPRIGGGSWHAARAYAAVGADAVVVAACGTEDEDAFRALRTRQWNAVTVHVGEGTTHGVPTEAEFVLPDPLALRELLDWLLTIWERLGPSDA